MPFIIAAIFSSLSYALSGTVNGIVSKHNAPLHNATWAALLGILIFSVPLGIFFRDELARLTLADLGLILGLGAVSSFGYLSFITGMSKGSVTLTGVIAGASPALTTCLSLVIFHDHINVWQLLAIAAIVIGIVLSSVRGNLATLVEGMRSPALIFGLGAFFGWGIYYALVRIPVSEVGWFLPQWLVGFSGIVLCSTLAWVKGEGMPMVRLPKLVWLIALIAALQLGASMLYTYAISLGPVAIIAPISGSSQIAFVLIAYFVFKEKLYRAQWLGVGLTVAAITALAIA